MASRPSFLLCVLAAILYLSPALAFYPNITTPSYAVDFGLNVLSARAEPDCTPYKKTEGSFCGPLCGCDPGLTCISGKCSTASAPALVNPGCTSDDQCPDGMGCGWVTGNKVDGTACGMRYARCTKQSDCSGQYVCVDAQYTQLIKGKDDYANCDGADQGQAFVCTYNDKGGAFGDSFCQNNDPNWNKACGDVRRGSTVTGVCNGMWTPCDLATPTSPATSCFWGFCIGRTYNGLTDYCTWKPGPCDTDNDCDNGLLCGPNGYCGGPGTKCTDNNFCGDPYPCMDDGTGKSFCANYNANLKQTPAKDYDQNSGLRTVCDYNNGDSTTCGDTSYCGQSRDPSTQLGVCGGANAVCYSDNQCATGGCDFNTYRCKPWYAVGSRVADQSCDYQTDCGDGLACVDNGLGVSTCRAKTSINARICQVGWAGACVDDPNFSSCGFSRSGSVEMGVCGGQGASCETSADCWTGTCNDKKTCEFGPTPTGAMNYRRRSAERKCRRGQELCPVGGKMDDEEVQVLMSGWECVDTQSTIDSCGGCMWGSDRPGKDCTEIDGVDIVSCTNGQCIIDSCAPGWSMSNNATSCVRDEY